MLLVLTLLLFSQLSSGITSSKRDLSATGAGKAGHFPLDIISDRTGVVVSVDKLKILEHKDVGVHLVVLDERHGEFLQHRFYNITSRLWAEHLVLFLNTIKDGRIVIMASQGVSSELLGDNLQLRLTLLGSQHVKYLDQGGHWAMVVEMGYPVLAEDRANFLESVHININVSLKTNTDKNGDTCGNLLTNGHLGEFKEWHPDGCRMHQYSTAEATTCFQRVMDKDRHTHLIFIGDSRIRNLYAAFMKIIDPEHVVVKSLQDKSIDHKFENKKLKLLVEYFRNPNADEAMFEHFNNWRNQSNPARLIVVGSATWTIRAFNGEMRGVELYAQRLTQLAPIIDDISEKNSTVIWTLQEPTVYERPKMRTTHFTSEQMALYNDAAIKALRPSKIRFWSSIRRIAEGNLNDCVDGIHHGQLAVVQDAQILFNTYCNEYMKWSDDTCCSGSEDQ